MVVRCSGVLPGAAKAKPKPKPAGNPQAKPAAGQQVPATAKPKPKPEPVCKFTFYPNTMYGSDRSVVQMVAVDIAPGKGTRVRAQLHSVWVDDMLMWWLFMTIVVAFS